MLVAIINKQNILNFAVLSHFVKMTLKIFFK